MAEFRNKIKSKKELKDMGVNEEILNEIKRYNNIAIFNNAQFLNKHSKIKNFQLSKTSFLMTDVREVMFLYEIEKEKILSHALYKDNLNKNKNKEKTEGNKNKLDESRDNEQTKNGNNTYYQILNSGYYYFNELIDDIKYNSVLAEYRNLRLSIENNITYEEASNLHKLEMEFKKKYSDNNFEKIAIELYEILSNYGESVEKSVLWIILAIILLPLIALLCNYYTLSCCILVEIIILFRILYLCIPKLRSEYLKIHDKVSHIISKIPYSFYFLLLIISFVVFIYTLYIYPSYGVLLRDTITAFFQLSIDDTKNGNYEHFMKNWEGIIRIISLILLGNLYIALRRRLSRK